MRLKALTAILVLLIAGSAAAATIDFTSNAFSGANGVASFAAAGVTLTAAPSGALLTWNASSNFNNGIGIQYDYLHNQIEGPELLTVSFSTPVYISSVQITNLYEDAYQSTSGYYPEIGQYQLNGTGAWISFSALSGQYSYNSEGLLTLQINSNVVVNSIAFMADGKLPALNQDHEFSVAKIEASAVPIPAAAWLLGTGLVGLVALRRRKND